ncbi:MAG: hypothetical protein FIA99_18480 [Ruminiclostridium sp.]|nr:hypothetical protein [Ruminiclostridium sp.]
MGIRRLFTNNTKVWLAALLIVSFFAACGQSSKTPSPQQQSGTGKQEFEKAPQKLKSIESNIEKIFKTLDGPFVTVEDEKKQEDGQKDQKQQESTQQQTASKDSGGNNPSQAGQQSQGGKQPAGQQGKASQPEKQDPWKEIEPIISNLHYQWNDFMPDAVKKGADPKITGNFSNALNTLTNTIKSKDKIKTLSTANALYGCVFDLYSVYRTEMSPEIKRMRYLIRNTILDSITGSWEQAIKDAGMINASWSLLKNTFGKEQQTDAGKLDFSILELEKVITEKNPVLTDIKGRVALSNIQSIEKSYEKKSG